MATTLARRASRGAYTIKRVLADELNAQIRRRQTSKAALARELGTSRTALDRVLDPKNTSITLRTLVKAADKLGYRINLTLEARIDKVERVPTPTTLAPLVDELGQALDRLPTR